MAFDPKAGFDPERLKRVAKATIAHNRICNCDKKYIMSCPKMAQAILDTVDG